MSRNAATIAVARVAGCRGVIRSVARQMPWLFDWQQFAEALTVAAGLSVSLYKWTDICAKRRRLSSEDMLD